MCENISKNKVRGFSPLYSNGYNRTRSHEVEACQKAYKSLRRTDRIKALYWKGDGFLLLYKRLEKGKFQWPRSENEALSITPQQYRWLMEGLSIQQPKAHRKMEKIKFG